MELIEILARCDRSSVQVDSIWDRACAKLRLGRCPLAGKLGNVVPGNCFRFEQVRNDLLRVPRAALNGWQSVERVFPRFDLQEREIGELAWVCFSNGVERTEYGEVKCVVRQPVFATPNAIDTNKIFVGFATVNLEN